MSQPGGIVSWVGGLLLEVNGNAAWPGTGMFFLGWIPKDGGVNDGGGGGGGGAVAWMYED